MKSLDELLVGLLADEDLTSELGKVRAYRRCLRYAEEHLATDLHCNEFLQAAAQRLQQPPTALPIIHHRNPLPPDGKLCFYYHDDEGPTLVGNHAGLAWLGRLFHDLAEAPPPENVDLPEELPCFVADSYGLLVYHELPEWFEAVEEGQEDELVAGWEEELEGRILTSEEVAAVQFLAQASGSLALSLQKLYRVRALRVWSAETDREVRRKPYRRETDRVRVLSLIDDDGQPLELGVDLDDPDLSFYYDWHLEQLAGP